MAWSKKKNGSVSTNEEIGNILEASSVVRGELKSDRGFRIDGKVEGTVESTAAIIIGESGVVIGEVRGSDVIVVGRVEGNIYASGHLDIGATGKVIGDVTATSFRIETGGTFLGTSRMGGHFEHGDNVMAAVESLA